MQRTVLLIVLDGWGVGEATASINPIHAAQLETLPRLKEEYPTTALQASGISVGLPWGEVGNSEVGHLTIGAGKVLYQHFPRITMAIRDGSFFENVALKGAFAHAKKHGKGVNLIGLLTEAHTHASVEHLQALIEMAEREKASNIKLHLFADGKDSAPRTLEPLLAKVPAKLVATVTGRYYGMDRRGNWQLTQQAYDCLTSASGKTIAGLDEVHPIATKLYEEEATTEEFFPPVHVGALRVIEEGDAVIFFNFREDSIRQITKALVEEHFDKFPTQPLTNLYVATMTRYEEGLPTYVAFPPETIEMPLGRVLTEAGKVQLRIAETYKYAHITYFFNGFHEVPYHNEYRVLIPSLVGAHPEEHPTLQAKAITDRIVQSLQSGGFDFILANYANADTIGHTGNFDAGVEAARVIDRELTRVLDAALTKGTIVAITADHGNLERMRNPATGRSETQHDPSPVPFYLVATEFKGRRFINWNRYAIKTSGTLADVAPTILQIMGIPKPDEMTGRSLLDEIVT